MNTNIISHTLSIVLVFKLMTIIKLEIYFIYKFKTIH